jgi:uncharacterized membrane protein
MMKTTEFLSLEDEKKLVELIQKAEQQTTGEIRLHVEMKCPADPLTRAKEVFAKLEMYQTQQRNGILIYVAFGDRKAAIYGDEGIASQVPKTFWDDELERLLKHFKQGNYHIGIQEIIEDVSSELKGLFPVSSVASRSVKEAASGRTNEENPDELSNEISRG